MNYIPIRFFAKKSSSAPGAKDETSIKYRSVFGENDRKPVTVLQSLGQCLCQLVGTRRSLAAAVDTLATGDDLLGLHAAHERHNALGVAVAAAQKLDIADDAVLDFDGDLSRAGALTDVSDGFCHDVMCVIFA